MQDGEEYGETAEHEEGEKITDEALSVQYWLAQLDSAKEAARPHWKDADRAWIEYLGGSQQTSSLRALRDSRSKTDTRHPVYWSAVRTIQPALYSRTPIPVSERTFDEDSDPIARMATQCLERLAKYLMRSTPFDRVQYKTRDDYILTGKTTERVVFEANINQEPVKKYVTQIQVPAPQQQPRVGPDGQPMPPATPQMLSVWVDSEGEQLPPTAQVMQDEQGPFVEDMEEQLERVSVDLVPVHYRDILHTPNARHWDEVDWVAFRTLLTKEDAEERFGEEKAKLLQYNAHAGPAGDETEKKSKSNKAESPDRFVEVYEIWCKRKRKVYWLAECYKDDFVDVKEDPFELSDFFPCVPFMLGTCGPDDLYPLPDFIQLRPLIMQRHALAARLQTQVKSLRTSGLFDQGLPELADLMRDGSDNIFIGVKNFKELVGDGGLENVIKFFPLKEISDTIKMIVDIDRELDAKFNDLYGIPDILRGVSDPSETAAAQQLKGRYLSLRFSATQREFQRVVRDSIELMCDLALKKFPEDKLVEVMGVRYMQPDEQQLWPQVKLLLQDDDERKVRINIETDSTITMNEQAESEQRTGLAKVLFDGLGAMGQLAQAAPGIMPVIAETILYTVRGTRDGKQIEGSLEQAIQQMAQAAQQPPQPPQPDPNKVAELQMQQEKNRLDYQIAQAKLQLQQADLQVKGNSLAVELQKIAAATQGETERTALDAQIASMNNYLEQMRLDLDTQYAGMEMAEKIATEKRLAREEQRKEQGGGEEKQAANGKAGGLTIHLHQ